MSLKTSRLATAKIDRDVAKAERELAKNARDPNVKKRYEISAKALDAEADFLEASVLDAEDDK